jgi:hypothetical protein
MNKLSLIALLFVSASSLAMSHKAPVPAPVETDLPGMGIVPEGIPSPAPSSVAVVAAPSTKIITLTCDSTCTAAQRAEVPAIEAAMNQTLSSKCFEQFFEAPGLRIDLTGGLTPAQIVAKLRTPSHLTLNYFYNGWPSKEEGYESAQDFSVIHFNSYFTDGWPICDKASLGDHEMSHTKQFWHKGNLAAPNYFTVPYQVNHATDACCGK